MLVSQTLALVPPDAPLLYRDLIKIFGQGVADEDLCFFYPELLAAMTAAHWEMLCAPPTRAGVPGIRIYTPPAGLQPYRLTVVEVTSADMAFLVDSIAAEVNRHDLLITLLNHPILHVRYGKDGMPQDIATEPREGYKPRSHIHMQIKRVLSDAQRAALEAGMVRTVGDVHLANRDWPTMRTHLREARRNLETARAGLSLEDMKTHCDFLDYLHDNNFTLLGYREYAFVEGSGQGEVVSQTIAGTSLGLLHDDVTPAYVNESAEGLPLHLQQLRRALPPVAVSKTNRLSTVHRHVPMDAIAVKMYGEGGQVVGERLFLGLFTSTTYSRSVMNVPYLREKVSLLLDSFGFLPGSHNHKAVRHILEKYPRDELFQIDLEELRGMVLSIMRLSERQRIALFTRADKFGRYISCLVYVPRDRFGTNMRLKMQAVLERELDGECTSFSTTLDDSVFARVMYVISVDQKNFPQYDTDHIESLLQELGRTWAERLTIALADALEDEDEIAALSVKYADAFPPGYSVHYEARRAVFDISNVERTFAKKRMVVDLYRPTGMDARNLRLKVYNPGAPLTLSDVMPILTNMGLRAISELPFEVTPAGAEHGVWMHDFLLEVPDGAPAVDLETVKNHFEHAFLKVWAGDTESDRLNHLIITAAMNWHEVAVLRAYVRYMKQIRYPLGRNYVERTLVEHPGIARLLVDLFKALHRPTLSEAQREAQARACADKITHALEGVTSLDQDRIARAVMGLIQATVRTNYFQRRETGLPKHYLALKIASEQVDGLPAPRPFREIFVSSPRVEGVHLRGARIARGGLRWSDRPEDYRTEILGLMKAQLVKNSVIVPSGSKGGFIVKKPPAIGGRAALQAEGVECYKTFIRALLDVTDNRRGDVILPPPDVVRRDGDDPYLVVAADKGTATFSDIANGIAAEYGFWLGDAFASGGSAGYDHKGMGITAKGAWESVKAHFRAMGQDTQTQDFDVVGVGDMGGDVFGNGMLLSEHIRLVGAFNHLHIFCDPNPDPAISFVERKRLFDAVQGWDGYDTKLLSKGGRIYSRADKVLVLTPEIRERFDIDAERVAPADLIRAMLRAPADLLWFGGIGTYVKARHETHDDVGDKANDALRIDAHEVGAKVIGEGANLGVTQPGRVAFAAGGGRINTDFIDNAGGVNTSDHEVNIKILLADIMAAKGGGMTRAARDALLAQMTQEVAAHVLRDNADQALAIDMAQAEAARDLRAHDAFISALEAGVGLVRAHESLPDEEEVAARARAGRGLTRPELSVLIAYAKISLDRDLLASALPDDPATAPWLHAYFPQVLQSRYAEQITAHQLRREIVATTVANHIVNTMGPIFAYDMARATGAGAAEIARAYLVVEDALSLRRLRADIRALGLTVPADVQVRALRDISAVAAQATGRLLSRAGACEAAMGAAQGGAPNFAGDIAALGQALPDLIPADLKTQISARTKAMRAKKFPAPLAARLAALPALGAAFDVVCVARGCGADLQAAARTYFTLGQRFAFDWLRGQAGTLSAADAWQAQAGRAVVEALWACQAQLAARVLADAPAKTKDPVAAWAKTHAQEVERVTPTLEALRAAGGFDLSMLIIAEQRLRGLCGG